MRDGERAPARERDISVRGTQITVGSGILKGGGSGKAWRWQVTDPSVLWENMKRSIASRKAGPHRAFCLLRFRFQIGERKFVKIFGMPEPEEAG